MTTSGVNEALVLTRILSFTNEALSHWNTLVIVILVSARESRSASQRQIAPSVKARAAAPNDDRMIYYGRIKVTREGQFEQRPRVNPRCQPPKHSEGGCKESQPPRVRLAREVSVCSTITRAVERRVVGMGLSKSELRRCFRTQV